MVNSASEDMPPLDESINSTMDPYADPVSYQCYDNGTLLVPVQIGPMNQTLTTAEEVTF